MKKIIFFSMLFLLSGCASVRVALYNKDIHYSATDPQSIEIFQKKPDQRKFIEIGEITVEGASSVDQVNRIFRIKAAEFGGNAVYVYSEKEAHKTYVYPHECHYNDGYFYPHGRYRRPYLYHRGYFPSYDYCYGYNDIYTDTFLTEVGIVIRYE